MKIRNGYVSNSSSSSFYIFGDKIKMNDVEKCFKKGKRVLLVKESSGISGDSQDFIAEITENNSNVLLKNLQIFDGFYVIKYEFDGDLIELKNDIFEKFYHFYKDYSSSNDEKDINEWLEIIRK